MITHRKKRKERLRKKRRREGKRMEEIPLLTISKPSHDILSSIQDGVSNRKIQVKEKKIKIKIMKSIQRNSTIPLKIQGM